jgi:hypothetical protein
MFKLAKTTLLVSALVISSAALAAGPAAAPGAAPSPNHPQATPAELQLQARTLQQKLASIQQKVLAANPKLAEQRKALGKLIVTAMKDQGATPKKDSDRLDELKKQISKPGVTQKQRSDIIQEARTIQQRLRQAQQKAMQNEDVQKAQKKYTQDLVVAMKAQDANTDKLFQNLQQIIQQLRTQQLMQQQAQQKP